MRRGLPGHLDHIALRFVLTGVLANLPRRLRRRHPPLRGLGERPRASLARPWIAVLVALWIPSTASAASPEEALTPAGPTLAAPAVAVAQELTTLWVEGEVATTSGKAGDEHAAHLLCGEVVAPDTVVAVPAGGRVVWLGGDLELLTATGPATHRWTGDSVVTLTGSAPSVSSVEGYREGPRPVLPPVATPAPDDTGDRDVGLAFVAPAATVLRDVDPVLRWRWAEADARFDLTLERLLAADERGVEGSSAAAVVVERWRALAGRSLVLWRPLDRGSRYRATISLHGARALARVVTDRVDFDVLDELDEAALDATLAALRGAGRGAALRPELEVLRARAFESYGLLSDAERSWAALALLYPGRPELIAQARRLAIAAERSTDRVSRP